MYHNEPQTSKVASYWSEHPDHSSLARCARLVTEQCFKCTAQVSHLACRRRHKSLLVSSLPVTFRHTMASPRHTHAVPMLMPMHMRGACPGEHAQYYHACAYMPRCRTGRQAMRRRRRLVSCRPAPSGRPAPRPRLPLRKHKISIVIQMMRGSRRQQEGRNVWTRSAMWRRLTW